MGQNIYMTQLIEAVNNIAGVLNVTDIKIFNKVGDGQYSLNETSQAYADEFTKEIDLGDDFAVFGEYDTMFEIKFPNSDIRVRTKA
jgi:hypothetical protein